MARAPGEGPRRETRRAVACTLLLAGSPLLVAYLWLSCEQYACAISGPLLDIALSQSPSAGRGLLDGLPRPTLTGFAIFGAWYAWQAVLAVSLPGRIGHGAITPAGHRPAYRLNGLVAWLVTHALFGLAAFRWPLVPPTIVADNGGGLLIAANAAGILVAVLAYAKARRWPSRPENRRWTGHAVTDFVMGVELNPRVGSVDLKLFHVGHVGMIAWTVVNASYAAKQFEALGYVTTSMILVNLLQLVYVLDFFAREDWYLRTIDMHHDRFGFLLAWGSAVWIPFVYTLQAAYLVRHPVELSPAAVACILALAGAGYAVFLSANRQRDRFRRAGGAVRIWRRPATSIPASYETADGAVHHTRLLTSGWWGLARHANYAGDIMMAAAASLACGFAHALPYFYAVYLTALLVHRVRRDDRRCRAKYGAAWTEYCAAVPYRMIPGVW